MTFFSIIIPTYNRQNFISKAIDSVLGQSFQNFELIIVDDGSTDQTQSLLKSYHDERLQIIQQKNHGVSHARNRGIENSSGEFICFLDSDDWFLSQKLEKAFEAIQSHSDLKIFHTKERWYRGGTELSQKKKHENPDGWIYSKVVPMCCVSLSTAVVHNSVFHEIGLFDENFPACEDYDFWLRSSHQYPFKLIPEVLTEKDGGRDDQLSCMSGLDRYRILALEKMLKNSNLEKQEYHLTYQQMIRKIDIHCIGASKRGRHSEVQTFQQLIKKYKKDFDHELRE